MRQMRFHVFFFNDTATTEIYTLSLHDALPICAAAAGRGGGHRGDPHVHADAGGGEAELQGGHLRDAGRLPRERGDARRAHGADPGPRGAGHLKLAGQVAVVTGAGRGIGRAVAVRLAREGAAVALAARSAPELEGVAREIAQAGGRAAVIPVDVRQEALVEALTRRALAEWGRVDVLVNAAGLATFAPVTDSKLDDWDQMLAVNLRGAVLCCRAVLPAMIAQRRGTIINVGSVVTSRTLTG